MRGFLAFLCFVGIFSASVVLSGCGGSSSSVSSVTGDNKVYVTGRFGSDYAYYKNHWWNRLFPRALATYGTVEKLVAVPIVRGDVWVGGIQEVQVGSDGSFSLSLTKQCEGSNWCEGSNATWVVLVKKTDGTYQTLSVGAQDIGDSLVDFPIYLAATNIDVGTLSSSRDEARGDKDVSDIAPNFSVGASKLENIAMVDDVLMVNKEGVIIYCNQNFIKKFGDKKGKQRKSVCATKHCEMIKLLEDVRKSKSVQRKIIECKCGKMTYLDVIVTPIFDNDSNFIGTLEVMRDVTDRVLKDREVRELKDYYQEIISSLKEGLIVTDKNYKIAVQF
jgi:PAS domain S-box-containing protein